MEHVVRLNLGESMIKADGKGVCLCEFAILDRYKHTEHHQAIGGRSYPVTTMVDVLCGLNCVLLVPEEEIPNLTQILAVCDSNGAVDRGYIPKAAWESVQRVGVSHVTEGQEMPIYEIHWVGQFKEN